MTVRPGLVPRMCLALVVAFTACAAKPRVVEVDPFYAEVPRTSITAITVRHTACDGTCPVSTLRLTADGRATYESDGRTPFARDPFPARRGRFNAEVDFEEIAAWVDSQHPETLADRYDHNVNGAPEVILQIARGKHVKTIYGIEPLAPLRFVGIVFAIEGASWPLHWRRDEPYTALLGDFTNGSAMLTITDDEWRGLVVGGKPESCPLGGRSEAIRVGDAIRISCGGATSAVRATADGLRVEGRAIAAGAYRRISWREAAHLDGHSGLPIQPD